MNKSHNSLAVLTSNGVSTSSSVLLTPGRTRNIAQDMEALRLSRQDNPYIKRVMASRDCLTDSHNIDGSSECESDDNVILMSQEFGSMNLESLDEDPVTLKEVHSHMIRSPPPIHNFGMFRASSACAFDFSTETLGKYSSHESVNEKRGSCRARSCGPHRPLSLPVSDESCKLNRRSLVDRSGAGERFTLLRLTQNDESALLVPKQK